MVSSQANSLNKFIAALQMLREFVVSVRDYYLARFSRFSAAKTLVPIYDPHPMVPSIIVSPIAPLQSANL